MEIIFGVIVSLFVQLVKKDMKSSLAVIATCAVFSLVSAAVYTYLVDVNLWQSMVGIFMTAGAVYTYVIARFESTPTELPNG
jgi:hypothetical protein